jgi:beta-lactamase class A
MVPLLLALCAAGTPEPPQPRGAPSAIEQRLAARIQGFGGELGVYARELDTGETIAVGADQRFPTASLIKLAVMAEVYRQMAAGKFGLETAIVLGDEDKVGDEIVPINMLHAGAVLTVSDLLHLMIAYSDNSATNLLIQRVGTTNVNALLDSLSLPRTRLYRPTFRGGHPDVLPEEEKEFGLGSTTPREAATLVERIARGDVASPSAGEAMIALLDEQQDRRMIPRSLPFDRDRILVANKTGWDDEKLVDPTGLRGGVRTDAAYVRGPGIRYVIAICARRIRDPDPGVDNEALRTGAELSRMVYDHFLEAAPRTP